MHCVGSHKKNQDNRDTIYSAKVSLRAKKKEENGYRAANGEGHGGGKKGGNKTQLPGRGTTPFVLLRLLKFTTTNANAN